MQLALAPPLIHDTLAEQDYFTSETRMLPIVSAHYDADGYVIAEMPLDHGRPDILVLKPDTAELTRRARHSKDKWLPPPALRVLNEISVHGSDLHLLGYEYNMSAATVKRHVRSLRSFSLVTTDGSTVYLNEPYRAPFIEIWAIEMKLSDWKKGLAQAARHARFADYTSVALDARFAHRADLTAFDKLGVGLLRASSSGLCDIALQAKRQLPHRTVLRMSVFERAWDLMYRQALGSTLFHEPFGRPLSRAGYSFLGSLLPH